MPAVDDRLSLQMQLKNVVAYWLILLPACCLAAFIPENQRSIETITINVSSRGNDDGDGSRERPFRTLERAQKAVREANGRANVLVVLADGIFRLSDPLHFNAADGGQNGMTVTWQAAAGASPVIAGSVRVSGWKLHDAERNIYVAAVPVGADARQLWVNNRLARQASIEIPRSAVTFSATGLVLNDARYDNLAGLPAQQRIRPLRASTDNRAVGNWYTQAKVTGSWDSYNNNVLQDNVLVSGDWPSAARAVIDNAGIEKQAGAVTYGDAR